MLKEIALAGLEFKACMLKRIVQERFITLKMFLESFSKDYDVVQVTQTNVELRPLQYERNQSFRGPW